MSEINFNTFRHAAFQASALKGAPDSAIKLGGKNGVTYSTLSTWKSTNKAAMASFIQAVKQETGSDTFTASIISKYGLSSTSGKKLTAKTVLDINVAITDFKTKVENAKTELENFFTKMKSFQNAEDPNEIIVDLNPPEPKSEARNCFDALLKGFLGKQELSSSIKDTLYQHCADFCRANAEGRLGQTFDASEVLKDMKDWMTQNCTAEKLKNYAQVKDLGFDDDVTIQLASFPGKSPAEFKEMGNLLRMFGSPWKDEPLKGYSTKENLTTLLDAEAKLQGQSLDSLFPDLNIAKAKQGKLENMLFSLIHKSRTRAQ